MADWSVIEAALETWVTTVTGLPTRWRNRPQSPTFSNDGYALLSITGMRTLGLRDDLQEEYDATQPNGSQIRVYQSGQRSFTFVIQIRTDRTTVDFDAKHYTSLIRDRIRLPTVSTAVFKAAHIAYASILAETELPDIQDGRQKSVSQIDISFNASSIVEDTATTFVETVDAADLEIPEGTTVWSGDIPV